MVPITRRAHTARSFMPTEEALQQHVLVARKVTCLAAFILLIATPHTTLGYLFLATTVLFDCALHLDQEKPHHTAQIAAMKNEIQDLSTQLNKTQELNDTLQQELEASRNDHNGIFSFFAFFDAYSE